MRILPAAVHRITVIGIKRSTALGAVCMALAFCCMPPGAQAQDVRGLADRVDRLQRDVDTLNRQLARPGAVPAQPFAPAPGFSSSFIDRTDSRFNDVDTQIRALTGRVEELSFRLNEINARLDKLMGDVDFRLNAMERGGAGAPAPAASPAPSTRQSAQAVGPGPAPSPRPGEPRVSIVPGGPPGQAAAAVPALLPPGTAEQQYNYAYGELVRAQRGVTDFEQPEQLLRLFVQTHGTHRLAGSAQYWLGETYFARRDYRAAAQAFAEGLQKYPNSEKGADNLLRLGQSLGQINRGRDACGVLGEMERRYPQAPQSVKRDATRERQRLNCG